MPPNKKNCSWCGDKKLISEFYANGPGRISSHCKECHKARNKVHYEANRAVYLAREFFRSYGVPFSEYEKLYKLQKGRCAICKKKGVSIGKGGSRRREWLVTDHDHLTGLIRELLCHRCNHLLGHALEDVEILEAAKQYLTKHFVSGKATTNG